MLGDVHGGAGQQCMEILANVAARRRDGASLPDPWRTSVGRYRQEVSKYVPGYGHRFHPLDPRATGSSDWSRRRPSGASSRAAYLAAGRTIEEHLGRSGRARSDEHRRLHGRDPGRARLRAAMLGRGLFVLSRSVGILAHAWEQHGQGGRNKGPTPKEFLYSYTGPAERHYDPEP